jgi:hypothetical protein
MPDYEVIFGARPTGTKVRATPLISVLVTATSEADAKQAAFDKLAEEIGDLLNDPAAEVATDIKPLPYGKRPRFAPYTDERPNLDSLYPRGQTFGFVTDFLPTKDGWKPLDAAKRGSAELFIIGGDVAAACSPDEVRATIIDMIKLRIANLPFPDVDIIMEDDAMNVFAADRLQEFRSQWRELGFTGLTKYEDVQQQVCIRDYKCVDFLLGRKGATQSEMDVTVLADQMAARAILTNNQEHLAFCEDQRRRLRNRETLPGIGDYMGMVLVVLLATKMSLSNGGKTNS